MATRCDFKFSRVLEYCQDIPHLALILPSPRRTRHQSAAIFYDHCSQTEMYICWKIGSTNCELNYPTLELFAPTLAPFLLYTLRLSLSLSLILWKFGSLSIIHLWGCACIICMCVFEGRRRAPSVHLYYHYYGTCETETHVLLPREITNIPQLHWQILGHRAPTTIRSMATGFSPWYH